MCSYTGRRGPQLCNHYIGRTVIDMCSYTGRRQSQLCAPILAGEDQSYVTFTMTEENHRQEGITYAILHGQERITHMYTILAGKNHNYVLLFLQERIKVMYHYILYWQERNMFMYFCIRRKESHLYTNILSGENPSLVLLYWQDRAIDSYVH
jgi:hypothetical protein